MNKDLEVIENFKKEHFNNITRALTLSGDIDPMITLLVKNTIIDETKDFKEYSVCLIPLPKEAFDNTESKDLLAKIIPQIFKKIEDDNMEPVCYSFSSEAWMREMKNKKNLKKEQFENTEEYNNWKNLPKKEVLITTFETKDTNETLIDFIIRNGKMSDEKGNLIDCISLERYDEISNSISNSENIGGRLSNIFQDYLKNKKQ